MSECKQLYRETANGSVARLIRTLARVLPRVKARVRKSSGDLLGESAAGVFRARFTFFTLSNV